MQPSGCSGEQCRQEAASGKPEAYQLVLTEKEI